MNKAVNQPAQEDGDAYANESATARRTITYHEGALTWEKSWTEVAACP